MERLSYGAHFSSTPKDTLRPLTTGRYLAVQFSSLKALPTVIHICLQSALNVSHQYMHQ